MDLRVLTAFPWGEALDYVTALDMFSSAHRHLVRGLVEDRLGNLQKDQSVEGHEVDDWFLQRPSPQTLNVGDSDAMDRRSSLACMTCGQRSAAWLVAYGYDGPGGAGRILHYCGDDMRERIDALSFVLPLTAVLQDPDRWLGLVYEAGLSTSAPELVAEHLGLDPRSPWVAKAKSCIGDNS